eukprot:TRINITY_DN33881_c0_g1_i1.p1 TRINITY_DN33881_c0_g1~~TRINITY_DN33881_c0_g1_i1.p1  ORF type:complete len:516 (-),score=84.22 TRINITY_DN33881_c0_g1_i1:499-2046(-)
MKTSGAAETLAGADVIHGAASAWSASEKASLRWLKLLIVVTAALCVLQVVLGLLANSLTLIADSAHSTIDVITYGLNYIVEWLAIRAAHAALSDAAAASSSPSAVALDAVGAFASTAILLLATIFACSEALERLTSSGGEEDGEHFENVGHAMLIFAVAGTIANVATVVMFKRVHEAPLQDDEVSTPRAMKVLALPAVDIPVEDDLSTPLTVSTPLDDELSTPLSAPQIVVVPVPVEDVPELAAYTPPAAPAGLSVPRLGGRNKKKITFCNGYAGPSSVEAEPDSTGGCAKDGCADLRCQVLQIPSGGRAMCRVETRSSSGTLSHSRSTSSESSSGDRFECVNCLSEPMSYSASLDGSMMSACATMGCRDSACSQMHSGKPDKDVSGWSTWASTLHMVLHPGCGSGSVGGCGCSHEGGEAHQAAAISLNMAAAMLHLLADVLRSITILAVGMLIEVGVLRDAGKADAACALAVAAFIILGSVALFHRMAALLCGPSLQMDSTVQVEEESPLARSP